MVDHFDPNALRHDLLRRMVAAEAPQQTQEPGVLAKCADELQRWFCETSLMQRCRRCRGRFRAADYCADARSRGSTEAVPATPSACSSTAMPETSEDDAARAGLTAAGQSPSSTESPDAAALGTNARGNGVSAQGDPAARSCVGPGAPACLQPNRREAAAQQKPRNGFPARAIYGHVCGALRQLRQDIQVLLFLAFPRGSIYEDRIVEGIFQWHYTRRWWLCFDWSSVALILMLMWDVVMNPPHRVTLVLLFYSVFGMGLLLRKVLLFAAPSPPRNRRIWHNVLLCTFFFGRCVVCQPLLVNFATEGSRPFRTLQVEAFSSVIGLGMTNLSMVFMQQMQTIDMLLFCLANGVVFIFWIIFVLQMPLTDALHTAYVGSIVVTAVCVRQQRDLEDIERRTFEHELLHARGMQLRSADRIATQVSAREFTVGMHMLSRLRGVEHINF